MLISYSQNFEDVILKRVLFDIKDGFYIDVGANDPIIHSTTKMFYDLGWKGVNIEPVAEFYNKLKTDRVRDVNLELAIDRRNGERNFFEVPGTGLSSLNEKATKNLADKNNFKCKQRKIKTTTLNSIFKKYVKSDVHFLKIDVEGSELSVLKSIDLTVFRPWIIVVEAVKPLTRIESYKEWEFLLIDNNYKDVYFDGLNKFYLNQEHNYLESRFELPPSIFDNFILYEHYLATNKSVNLEDMLSQKSEQVELLQVELSGVTNKSVNLEDMLSQKSEQVELLQVELLGIYRSQSWKLTYPLRWIVFFMNRILSK